LLDQIALDQDVPVGQSLTFAVEDADIIKEDLRGGLILSQGVERRQNEQGKGQDDQ
jgi:hypothetical protein